MTASLLLRDHIDASVVSLLRSVVRRSVPENDVEDVVQSAVCDALRAPRIPERKEELSRWLVTIAKRRAADLHRACRPQDELGPDLAGPEVLPVEWRDLVQRAVDDASTDDYARRTLELSLREVDGEPYATLAHDEETSEVALRQRVSRFRRRMFARWLAVATFGAALVLGARAGVLRGTEATLIVPEEDIGVRASLQPLRGTWVVRGWSGSEPLVDGSRVTIDGTTLRLAMTAHDDVFSVVSVETLPDGSEQWHVRSPSRRDATVHVTRRAGAAATVTLREGRWAG
ncbi:MAG: hypothetical protein EOO75_00200, partial [Myxococcales bacterium]